MKQVVIPILVIAPPAKLHLTFDLKKGLMNRNTEDEATLSARIYEIVRLNNYEID
jgi:hypothetical protein